MCKKKKKDYRPFKEKLLDLMENKPWKFILYSFICALILFVVSILIKNKGGAAIAVLYPASLVGYGIDLLSLKRIGKTWKTFHFTFFCWILTLIAFIYYLLGGTW